MPIIIENSKLQDFEEVVNEDAGVPDDIREGSLWDSFLYMTSGTEWTNTKKFLEEECYSSPSDIEELFSNEAILMLEKYQNPMASQLELTPVTFNEGYNKLNEIYGEAED